MLQIGAVHEQTCGGHIPNRTGTNRDPKPGDHMATPWFQTNTSEYFGRSRLGETTPTTSFNLAAADVLGPAINRILAGGSAL